jgi:N-acetylglucosamine kinase-like BadF-type ATPase
MANQLNETIIGLDVGGTKTAVVEGTREAEILQRALSTKPSRRSRRASSRPSGARRRPGGA